MKAAKSTSAAARMNSVRFIRRPPGLVRVLAALRGSSRLPRPCRPAGGGGRRSAGSPRGPPRCRCRRWAAPRHSPSREVRGQDTPRHDRVQHRVRACLRQALVHALAALAVGMAADLHPHGLAVAQGLGDPVDGDERVAVDIGRARGEGDLLLRQTALIPVEAFLGAWAGPRPGRAPRHRSTSSARRVPVAQPRGREGGRSRRELRGHPVSPSRRILSGRTVSVPLFSSDSASMPTRTRTGQSGGVSSTMRTPRRRAGAEPRPGEAQDRLAREIVRQTAAQLGAAVGVARVATNSSGTSSSPGRGLDRPRAGASGPSARRPRAGRLEPSRDPVEIGLPRAGRGLKRHVGVREGDRSAAERRHRTDAGHRGLGPARPRAGRGPRGSSPLRAGPPRARRRGSSARASGVSALQASNRAPRSSITKRSVKGASTGRGAESARTSSTPSGTAARSASSVARLSAALSEMAVTVTRARLDGDLRPRQPFERVEPEGERLGPGAGHRVVGVLEEIGHRRALDAAGARDDRRFAVVAGRDEADERHAVVVAQDVDREGRAGGGVGGGDLDPVDHPARVDHAARGADRREAGGLVGREAGQAAPEARRPRPRAQSCPSATMARAPPRWDCVSMAVTEATATP
jgi:hypothetical protein